MTRPNASFNKYVEKSYSLAEQWTAPYFAQSEPSHPSCQKPTIDTMQQTLQLLDYLATQEDAVLSYHASYCCFSVFSAGFILTKHFTLCAFHQ